MQRNNDNREFSCQYPTTTARKYNDAQQHVLGHWNHVQQVVENIDRAVFEQRKNDLGCQCRIVSKFCCTLRMGVHRHLKGIFFV